MRTVHKDVWLLAGCQALMMSANALLIATSALVGAQLAPTPALSTLPLALQFLATMATTIPAALLMRRLGRRTGFVIGALLGLAGSALAAWAIVHAQFALFGLATALIGAHNGFGTFYRFAAADVASADYRARAISYVLAGGVVAAFVGPNLASWTHGWVPGVAFAGSFVALTGLYSLSLIALAFLEIPLPPLTAVAGSGRPLKVIARQGPFVVAVLAAMLGYMVMNLVMTATPLAMHAHAHAFPDTVFVIEWHVFGMFAPAFITGRLIARFGVRRVLLAGALLNGACVAINLAGTSVTHFWAALFLLGVGWNFLFVGGTTLLTETYTEAEKAKVQGLNDFLLYTGIATASLVAGALHHSLGWRAVNIAVVPLIVLVMGAVLWLKLRAAAPTAVVDPSGLGPCADRQSP